MADEQGYDPPALINRPELAGHVEWVWQAFWDLSGDRQIGFSEGPIMWLSIDAYARRHRIRDDRFDRLLLLIRRMDGAFLKARSPKKDK